MKGWIKGGMEPVKKKGVGRVERRKRTGFREGGE